MTLDCQVIWTTDGGHSELPLPVPPSMAAVFPSFPSRIPVVSTSYISEIRHTAVFIPSLYLSDIGIGWYFIFRLSDLHITELPVTGIVSPVGPPLQLYWACFGTRLRWM